MLNETSSSRTTLLRPRDQAVIATGIVMVLTLSVGGWFLGDLRNEVNLDTTPKRSYRFIIDINKAPWPEIGQLPGVGETVARRIVESREAEGHFRRVSDLRRVRGVGKTTLKRIKPYLVPLD